jgi:hypothetical protein
MCYVCKRRAGEMVPARAAPAPTPTPTPPPEQSPECDLFDELYNIDDDATDLEAQLELY